MELNWSTFILEILNFLVLVWLLKRFFYQPVKAMVVRRQQGIAQQLQEAVERQQQAEALHAQFENRLADWEGERAGARQALTQEIASERKRLLQELQEGLEAERQKAEVLAERRLQEQLREGEAQALELGARFVARLLERVASPELEGRLFSLLLDELRELPPAQRESLQALQNGHPIEADVVSAHPLDEGQRSALEQQLQALVPGGLRFDYHEDERLVAGLRVTVGPWVLHANLRDELKTFAAIAYEQ